MIQNYVGILYGWRLGVGGVVGGNLGSCGGLWVCVWGLEPREREPPRALAGCRVLLSQE